MKKIRRRMKNVALTFLLILAASFAAFTAVAHGEAKPEKTGILLVAFGTSVPEAQVAFDNINRKVKAAFPEVEVRWAFTSSIIRGKLAAKGKLLDSTAAALARMAEDGFTRVAVQSLHTIPGREYHELIQTAHAFASMPDGVKNIRIGQPLLAGPEDLLAAVEALRANLPSDRSRGEAVILMGHGTHHPSDVFYPALQYYLWKKDPLIFVATVEGSPSLSDVLPELEVNGVKKAFLMPFMSVAGDHARNDMAGDDDDSWKSILVKAGVEIVPVFKGTAEYDDMVDIWVDHLKTAMAQFE
jgi:sirohydrochlorin cobaltochelatase